MGYKSGFVAIMGRSNVGKSTLMNALIGQKVSIVTERAQTTRNRIQGVLSHDDGQIVFVDTPGVHTPRTRLGDFMVKQAYGALDGVDGVLLVLDAADGIGSGDRALLERLEGAENLFIALNKKDAATPEAMQKARAAAAGFEEECRVFEMSALTGDGVPALIEALLAVMPDGPQYFPDGMVTDQPERVLCAEMVREKALEQLREEIPHGIGVDLEKLEKRQDSELIDIFATIYCERESHKGMVIGKGGAMLRTIGERARADIERLLGMQVNLKIWVKVKPGWRDSPSALRMMGYYEQ